MSGIIQINPDTGLPETPENFFWRVTPEVENSHGTTTLGQVQLIYASGEFKKTLEPMPFIWWNPVNWFEVLFYGWVQVDSDEPVEKIVLAEIVHAFDEVSILAAASRLIRQYHDRSARAVAIQRLSGDYPPKRVGS